MAAVLQTLKSAGMISATILTVVCPAAGKPLSLAYSGVDIAADVQKESHTPMLLVITKDVRKETVKKAAETAVEKGSELLAEHVADKATEVWFETVSNAPWGNLSQPTAVLGKSLDNAQAITVVGKNAGLAFAAYDIYKQLVENYEAWKTVSKTASQILPHLCPIQ